MSKFSVAVALLCLMLVTVYALPAANDDVSESERKVFQETLSVEDAVAGGAITNAVTPRKSIFLPNLANVQCWICSSPCSAYYCCNDGYPQCCLVCKWSLHVLPILITLIDNKWKINECCECIFTVS
ncbi:unnamed protein product [Orchesella dallaii]|uniref:Uncharacterized protein n=1 Tax=Orchesella dallaii TaxID=48710 RepID=A0ABP1R744_9HEXA